MINLLKFRCRVKCIFDYHFSTCRVLGALHLKLDSHYCAHKEKGLYDRGNPFDGYGCLRKLALLRLVDLGCPLFIT